MQGFCSMKCIFLITLVFSFNAYSQDFSGCGEYLFKGVLRHDEQAPLKLKYVVNENTNSQMIFTLLEKEDVKKLAIMIDLPTTMKANITKPMDGTKGVITFPSEIGRRLPNPLVSKDTGITKIKNFKCD